MDKHVLKGLEIDIFNLQDKTYNYVFEVDDKFFLEFDGSLINKGNAAINITLKKSITFIELKLTIEGTIALTCDRSLEQFDYPILIENDLIFKFGDEHKELDEFMVQIPLGTEKIHLGQYIYEFISLAIPMKKLHPKFQGMEDEEEGTLVYSSKSDTLEDIDDSDSEKKDEPVDPRWQKLNELRNNKK